MEEKQAGIKLRTKKGKDMKKVNMNKRRKDEKEKAEIRKRQNIGKEKGRYKS